MEKRSAKMAGDLIIDRITVLTGFMVSKRQCFSVIVIVEVVVVPYFG